MEKHETENSVKSQKFKFHEFKFFFYKNSPPNTHYYVKIIILQCIQTHPDFKISTQLLKKKKKVNVLIMAFFCSLENIVAACLLHNLRNESQYMNNKFHNG